MRVVRGSKGDEERSNRRVSILWDGGSTVSPPDILHNEVWLYNRQINSINFSFTLFSINSYVSLHTDVFHKVCRSLGLSFL